MAVTAATTTGENGIYEFPYVKPPDKTKWETVRTAIWDSSTSQLCGRTPKSWGKIF